ncbi:MAG: S8 family serine peptidase, partial [Calditrichota bacterium]
MIKSLFKVLLGFAFAVSIAQAGAPADPPVQDGLIILTLFPEVSLDVPIEGAERSGNTDLDRFLDDIQAFRIQRTFPYCTPPKSEAGDLTVLWTVTFPPSFPPDEVCSLGAAVKGVRYAEPSYIYQTFLDHNDPLRNNQYGLDLCRANEAHDLSTGDRGTPVAIVDTGMDMDHSDLVHKVWINPGEDLNGNGVIDNNERNGQDDDRSGFADDFYGWDYMSADNDPNDTWGHGTHCAGIAAAETNNRIGVASIGYNCSIMVIRAGSEGTVNYGYQGIEYAARMGAKVISCSWGGDGHNNWSVRVINNAWANGALIVAAAGNENADHINYPAGDEHVIAVAATDERDRRANFSNYGDWVDISAPGVNILSTIPNNRYGYMSGTSMACP